MLAQRLQNAQVILRLKRDLSARMNFVNGAPKKSKMTKKNASIASLKRKSAKLDCKGKCKKRDRQSENWLRISNSARKWRSKGTVMLRI